MRTLSALITTTWSPESKYGVKLGLSLPISIRSTFVASRPSTWSVASTTNQLAPTFSASASSPFATYVLIAPSHTFPLETNFNLRVRFPPCQSRASSRTVYSHRFPLVLLAKFKCVSGTNLEAGKRRPTCLKSPYTDEGENGARGGSRTHMRKNPPRILSPQRPPFRHPGALASNLSYQKSY